MRSIVAGLTSLLLLAPDADACSKRPPGIGPFLSPNQAMMLATPTPDSVFTGPGAVKYTLAPGHNGPTRERAIYGQVMRVDSSAGPGSRPGSRVILVAWDYGPDCVPSPSGSSALWRREGAYGLYTAQLRDSAHWAGGVPTYDVFTPQFQPYMYRPGGMGALAAPFDSTALSLGEILSAARNFPVVRTLEDRDVGSKAFLDWAAANPKVASRQPLRAAVEAAETEQLRARSRRIQVPVGGTYRVTFIVSGTDSAAFYGRTYRYIESPWSGVASVTRGSEERSQVSTEGYVVAIYVAPDLAGLARPMNNSYLSVSFAPSVTEGGSRTWNGVIEPSIVRRGLAGAPIGDATLLLSSEIRATFKVGADGSASFEHRSRLSDGREIVIRGVRISEDVL